MAQSKLAQTAGIFRERLPAAALRRHLERVWTNELHGPAALQIVPDGCIDIYWTGSRLQIAGPNSEIVTAAFEKPADLFGVRFRPGHATQWLGLPAHELLNRHPPLEDIWGRRATAGLSDRLRDTPDASAAAMTLEHFLIGRLDRVKPPDAIVDATVAAASRAGGNGTAIVRSLTGEYGWSERTLRRRCLDAFGYGPKTLQRILRFQRFLQLLSERRVPLSILAIEAGYADQAHLAREARRLSGQSPSMLTSELQR